MPDKRLRQHTMIGLDQDKVKMRIQQMREEMDRAWRDFFEKNPDEKEEEVRRRVEERLRSKQNSKDQHKGI
jgi:hypothetical protein